MGGWGCDLKVEYMTWRSSCGVEHWSLGIGLKPADIGTDLPANEKKAANHWCEGGFLSENDSWNWKMNYRHCCLIPFCPSWCTSSAWPCNFETRLVSPALTGRWFELFVRGPAHPGWNRSENWLAIFELVPLWKSFASSWSSSLIATQTHHSQLEW